MIRKFTLVLVCSLMAGCGAPERPDGRTRAGLTAIYELVLAGHDTDGDGKLSQIEMEAMMNGSLSIDPQQMPSRHEIRDRLMEDFAAQDLDRDGYLDLAELLRKPLATFTCMDADSDGSLSHTEIQNGVGRCDPDGSYASLLPRMPQ